MMKSTILKLDKLKRGALAVLLIFLPWQAYAQNVDDGGGSNEKVDEEIIVTGTPGGAGIDKLDASFSISTQSAEQIERISPKSTADLFKTIPGVWAESSGGVSGANIFVRGLPGAGDAEFVTVQLQGLPIYPAPTLSFLENSTMFRLDETVERLEALRGGPNTVLSNAQPGLTSNFILKEGGEDTEGLIKLSTSDYNLKRMDVAHSGKIADSWYYMLGGYASKSPGVRDAGFDSEEGYQVTANITHDLQDGKFNLYSRITDDHGVWYLPIPLDAPGVDPGTFTQIGSNNRNFTLDVDPQGTLQSFDFGQGRGWDGHVTGLNFEKDLGEWSLSNRLAYTDGDANTFGLVPDGASVPVSSLGGIGITRERSGSALGSAEYVQNVGYWVVEKEIDSLVNDFSLTRQFGQHQFTAGLYYADFGVDERWNIGNAVPHETVANGQRVTGISCQELAEVSGSSCFRYGLTAKGSADTTAIYLADRFDINDRFTVDFGVRNEKYTTEYTVDDGPGFADGIDIRNEDFDESETTYTAGINYTLNDISSVFARINNGVKFPSFDDFREGNKDIKEVDQYEVGYKRQSEHLDFYASLFANEFKGNAFTPFPGAPSQLTTNEALGIEFDGSLYFGNFNLDYNATFQETEIANSTTAANQGNEAPRQPGWQFRVTPSYELETGMGPLTLYGTASLVDDRFSDPENVQVLDGYEKYDLGAILNTNSGWSFQLAADNVTDSHGLTEGDPRAVGQTASNQRPILGRSIKFSIAKHF